MRIYRNIYFAVLLLFPLKTYCRIMSRTIIHLMDRTDPYHIVSTCTQIPVSYMSELLHTLQQCYVVKKGISKYAFTIVVMFI